MLLLRVLSCMQLGTSQSHNPPDQYLPTSTYGVDYPCAVQFRSYWTLRGQCLVYVLSRCTNQHKIQVRGIPAYPHALEQVRSICYLNSVYICLLASSLAEEANVDSASEQALVHIIWQYKNVQGHGIPLERVTQNYMQMGQGFLVIVFHLLKSIYTCKDRCPLKCLDNKFQYRLGCHLSAIRVLSWSWKRCGHNRMPSDKKWCSRH